MGLDRPICCRGNTGEMAMGRDVCVSALSVLPASVESESRRPPIAAGACARSRTEGEGNPSFTLVKGIRANVYSSASSPRASSMEGDWPGTAS